MAFKMKNPLSGVDTSKKHGTNSNFMKSGMKNADGSEAAGAPFLGGLVKKAIGGIRKNPLDPLGLFGGRKGGKGGACPPQQAVPAATPPPEPTTPTAPAAPAPAAAEEAQPAATMKKDLMKGGAPKDKKYGPQPKKSTLDAMVKKSDDLAHESVVADDAGKSLKSEMLKNKGRKIRKSAKKIYKGGAPMTEGKRRRPDGPPGTREEIAAKRAKGLVWTGKQWHGTGAKLPKSHRFGPTPEQEKKLKKKAGAPMTGDKKVRRTKKTLRDIRREGIYDFKQPNWEDLRRMKKEVGEKKLPGVKPGETWPPKKKVIKKKSSKKRLPGVKPGEKWGGKSGAPNMKTGSYSQKFEK